MFSCCYLKFVFPLSVANLLTSWCSLLENDAAKDILEEVNPPENDAVISGTNFFNQKDIYIQKQFEAFLKQHELEQKYVEKTEVGESEIFPV